MVKHESHWRRRSASSPERSVVSAMVAQKHVGQTMVQLAQPRQRSATCDQARCSRLRASSAATSGTMLQDRKSTRLNSGHQLISYAVFCLKKKNFPAIVAVLPSEVASIMRVNKALSLG